MLAGGLQQPKRFGRVQPRGHGSSLRTSPSNASPAFSGVSRGRMVSCDGPGAHFGSGDVSFGAKVRSTGRADGAVAHHLDSFLGCITRIPKDSRDGPTLEAMEEAQLARLLINPDKADEIAGMNPAGNLTGEPERSAA